MRVTFTDKHGTGHAISVSQHKNKINIFLEKQRKGFTASVICSNIKKFTLAHVEIEIHQFNCI